MPQHKGCIKTGGRKKGTKNVDTEKIRRVYAQLLEDNIHKVSGWLDRIAKKDPKGAIDTMAKVSEYILPKLARTEVLNKGKALVNVNIPISLAAGSPGDVSFDESGVVTSETEAPVH